MTDPLVYTTKGLLPASELEVRDVVEWTDNARKITTNFYHHGEFVRNDVTVSILRPASVGAEQGSVG